MKKRMEEHSVHKKKGFKYMNTYNFMIYLEKL